MFYHAHLLILYLPNGKKFYCYCVFPDVFSGNVGLAITQSLALTGNVQWLVRQLAEIENQMTSVERITDYSTLESEANLDLTESNCHPYVYFVIQINKFWFPL